MEKRILIIDDEKDFTEIITTLLGFHGFAVEALNEPKGIAEAIKKSHYDLIVTDLMMPHLSGFDLIKIVRATPAYQKTPIIALTAKVLTDDERKMLLQSGVSVQTKPFEPQGLVDLIAQTLAG